MNPAEKIPFVFLTSHAFSGSTLTSFLMGMHPEIATVGELTGPARRLDLQTYPCSCGKLFQQDPFWQDVATAVNQYGLPYSLNNYLDTRFELSSHSLGQRLLAGSFRSNALEQLRDSVVFTLWPGKLAQLKEQARRNELFARAVLDVTGKSIFLDTAKDPMRIRYLPLAPNIDLHVIHLVRDVRGVVASIRSRHPDTNVETAVRSWIAREKNINRLLETIPTNRQIKLNYEELVTDTLPTLNKLLAFVGAQPLETLGDYREAEHHILGNRMRKRQSSEIKLDEKWRTALSTEQLQTISRMVGAR
ncbi:MAG: sulfotransferase [Ardenticatenaceae bacterium]|nr:sulfotransferase [Ardenticatenaceae bacterium]